MDDRELTLRLAAAAGVAVDAAQLAPLFDAAPELTEWSINPASDRRGTLRVSTPVGGRLRSKDPEAAQMISRICDRGYSPQQMSGGTVAKAPGT